MDNLIITKNGKNEILTISENILKENLRDLQKLLIDSINRSEILNIEFNNLKKTDMFFVQLLCSAHKYAVSKKKKIKLSGPLPETLKAVLESQGFYRDKVCIEEVEENCFLLREVAGV